MHNWFNSCAYEFGRLIPGGSMALFVIIILVVLGALIVLMVRQRGEGPGKSQRPSSPEEILKSRYARGEISRQEYQEMKSDLEET